LESCGEEGALSWLEGAGRFEGGLQIESGGSCRSIARETGFARPDPAERDNKRRALGHVLALRVKVLIFERVRGRGASAKGG